MSRLSLIKNRIFLFFSIVCTGFLITCGGGGGGSDSPPNPTPSYVAASVSFQDTDTDLNQVAGTITLEKAADETSITEYVVAFGYSDGTVAGGTIATVTANGSASYTVTVPSNTSVPTNVASQYATHIIVFSRDTSGVLKTSWALHSLIDSTSDWTIMYYADADNNLEEDIMMDINEMEGVDLSSKNINIIVLIDRASSTYTTDGDWTGDGNWTDTRAYKLGYDSAGYNATISSNSQRIAIPALGITATGSTECNMGAQATLQQFISFCKTSYPSTNYALFFSNHGGGWRNKMKKAVAQGKTNVPLGVKFDRTTRKLVDSKQANMKSVCWDDSNSNDYLTMKELHSAITNAMGTIKFGIISFDACLMGMVEVAYELKDVANILVASAETIPGFGFPYTKIMTDIKSQAGSITGNFFAQKIVNDYISAYTGGTNIESSGYIAQDVTISAIDLSKISAVASAVNSLATYVDADTNCVERLESSSYDYKENVDLRHFCTNIAASSGSTKTTAYKAAATAVITAIDNAILYKGQGSDYPNHGGMAIYFPYSTTAYDGYAPTYYTTANLDFLTPAANWKNLVTTAGGLTFNFGSDDHEPDNNSQEYAYNNINCSKNTNYTSYISYKSDIDWYDMGFADNNLLATATMTVTLTPPSGINYGMFILGIDSGELYYLSYTSTPTTGTKTKTATGYTEYLIGVDAVNGTDKSTTASYTLRASW